MQLMTKELERRFQEVGSQKDSNDPIVIAKFFNPTGAGTWYATEYDPQEKMFFGYASVLGDGFDEWGSFSLAELQNCRCRFGLGIERDMYCGEFSISKVLKVEAQ